MIDYYKKAPFLKKGEGKRRRIHFCPFCGEEVRPGKRMSIKIAGLVSQKELNA